MCLFTKILAVIFDPIGTKAVAPDTLEGKTYGTFTGSTLTDNSALKTLLQELETEVETKITSLADDTSPQLGGALDTNSQQVRWSKGADVASAASLPIGNDGNYFDVTGTSTITSIPTKGIGTVVRLHFDGILTLTHDAADLILPTGANVITAVGDHADFVEYAAGDWRCTNYQRADGMPIGGGAFPGTSSLVDSGNTSVADNTDVVLSTFTVTNGMVPLVGVSTTNDATLDIYQGITSAQPPSGDCTWNLLKTATANEYELHIRQRTGGLRDFDWRIIEFGA